MIVILALVILLLAGATIVAAHFAWFGLSLDTQIKPVEVLTLAVEIVIALLLQYYFANKTTDLRAEKDLLIDDIRDILSCVKLCRDSLDACHEDGKITRTEAKRIIDLFRRLSNSLERLESSVGMSQCRKLGKSFAGIRDSYLAFKMAATGGAFPSKPYPPTAVSDQRQACRSLDEKLQTLVFEVNKHR